MTRGVPGTLKGFFSASPSTHQPIMTPTLIYYTLFLFSLGKPFEPFMHMYLSYILSHSYPHHSPNLPWSALLSIDCRAANFDFTPLLSGPEINASFEKWKSNCLHRADEWRWLQTNYLAPGSTSVWLLSLATPFFSQASRLSYCFRAQGRSSAAAWEI